MSSISSKRWQQPRRALPHCCLSAPLLVAVALVSAVDVASEERKEAVHHHHRSSGRLGQTNFDYSRRRIDMDMATDDKEAELLSLTLSIDDETTTTDANNSVHHQSRDRVGLTNFDYSRGIGSGLITNDENNEQSAAEPLMPLSDNETTDANSAIMSDEFIVPHHQSAHIQPLHTASSNNNIFETSSWTVEEVVTSTVDEEEALQSEPCYNAPECPPCHTTQSCCMTTNYNIYNGGTTLGCTSNSLDFIAVTGFQVFDEGAYECNCGDCWIADGVPCPPCTDTSVVTSPQGPADCGGLPYGTVFGACRGRDDRVNVSFTVNVDVKGAQYDVGLYIATDGGEALNGQECTVVGLTETDQNGNPWVDVDGNFIVGDGDGDFCWDFINDGDLMDYPFESVILACSDNGPIDGLLDFSIAASFAQNAAGLCSYDGSFDIETGEFMPPPHPGTSSKCWGGERITLNIHVPPYLTPTSTPSDVPSISTMPSGSPSLQPSVSAIPSIQPSISTMPSISTAPNFAPSDSPSISGMPTSMPSESPSITTSPSSHPSEFPSVSNEPSSIPSESPSISTSPSSQPSENPSVSSQPSSLPSQMPSISGEPSSTPSESPSISSAPSLQPSMKPSISDWPTSQPSESPSISQSPSLRPTSNPSVSLRPTAATEWPSNLPSVSGMPSSTPSESPSISVAPSIEPTIQPSVSTGPTGQPSLSPSTSQRPSRLPSVSPSVSLAPTFTTEWPSESPTSTHAPSESPTFGPSVSQMPSVSPTYVPTGKPSIAPSTSQLPTCGGNDIDCGYGFWNIWTCQCDCAPGYCLSANQKCYDGCTTRTAFNPFGGCIPGTDCPWYPEPSGKTYCVTTVNVAGQYNLHRIAEHCCEKHFSYLNINTCVSESEQSVEVAKETIAATKERPMYYYPDVYGRDNCIYWNGYYNWMEAEGYSDSYLFDSATDCCSMWYPGRTNCPDISQPTDRDINENPYPVKGYFYPHFDESNCRFGRNYPMYMGQELYVQHYLFTTPDECCSKFFPTAGESCPLGPDDGVQQGRYWKVDVYFYPDWDGRGDYCIVGDAYPEWMADPIHKPTHLFMTATDCCEKWFSDEVSECEASIVAVDKEDDEEKPKKDWYPTLVYPFECLSDGNIPSWMLQTGYKAYYVFKSKAACCKAYYCSN